MSGLDPFCPQSVGVHEQTIKEHIDAPGSHPFGTSRSGLLMLSNLRIKYLPPPCGGALQGKYGLHTLNPVERLRSAACTRGAPASISQTALRSPLYVAICQVLPHLSLTMPRRSP